LGLVKIAVIGPGTAEKVKEYHMAVDLMPEKKFVAEGLIEKFKKDEAMEHLKVLWVRAEEAREVVAEGLRQDGSHRRRRSPGRIAPCPSAMTSRPSLA